MARPPVAELVTRRRELCAALGQDRFVALFEAGEPKLRSGDVDYPFRPDSTFYYLTGLAAPLTRLLVTGGPGEEGACHLFVERHNPLQEVWVGRKSSADEVAATSGIESVRYLEEFEHHLVALLGKANVFYLAIEPAAAGMCLPRGQQLVGQVRKRLPHLPVAQACDAVARLRRVKSPYEVACMSHAIRVTCEGLLDTMREVRPGMPEALIEAKLAYGFASRGCKEQGFPSVIASGANATVLHYMDNSGVALDGDMVLMDVSAEYAFYGGDVSRTIPVSGVFRGKARELYQGVLYVQKEVLQRIHPGVSLSELNQFAAEGMGEVLHSAGLVSDARDLASVRQFYMHGIGHYLGLDAHDPGSPLEPLVPGVVLTVEPGVYVKNERIGIRIEDDVLVTESGCRVLSDAVPKEMDDLEAVLGRGPG